MKSRRGLGLFQFACVVGKRGTGNWDEDWDWDTLLREVGAVRCLGERSGRTVGG